MESGQGSVIAIFTNTGTLQY
jgi:hypothetical protein